MRMLRVSLVVPLLAALGWSSTAAQGYGSAVIEGYTSAYPDGSVHLEVEQSAEDTFVIRGRLSKYVDGMTALTLRGHENQLVIQGQISKYPDGQVHLVVSGSAEHKVVTGSLSRYAGGETNLVITTNGRTTAVLGRISRYDGSHAGRFHLVFEELEDGRRRITGGTSRYPSGSVELHETSRGGEIILEGHVSRYPEGDTRLVKRTKGNLKLPFDDMLLIILAQAHRRQVAADNRR